MESLLDYILVENSGIQCLNARGGPEELTAAHERVTILVWKLRQIDPTNPTFIKAWNMLVDYGEKDLRAMLLYRATAAIREYTHAFSRLKVKIGKAVSVLSIKEQVEPLVPVLTSVATALWQERRIK